MGFVFDLTVKLEVQITCKLTALHTLVGELNKQTFRPLLTVCTKRHVPLHYNKLHDVRNEHATFLPYHFPSERGIRVSSSEIRYTMDGQQAAVAPYRWVQ
jgi:hypothetical protein